MIDDVSLGVDVCDGDEVALSEGLLGVSLGVRVAVAVDVALSVTVYLCTTIPPTCATSRGDAVPGWRVGKEGW